MKKASIALAVAATIGSMSAFAATSSISVGSITPSETKPANEIKVLKEDARRDMQIKANQERIADNFQQTIEAVDSVTLRTEDNAEKLSRVNQKVIGNTAGIAVNKDDITANKDKLSRVNQKVIGNTAGIAVNKDDIASNTKTLKDHDVRISKNAEDISSKMKAEEQARQAQAADFEKKTQDLTNGLSLTNTAVASNTAALEKNTQSIEQNTARIGRLEDKVDDNTYGIAMSMAMSALPPAYSVGEFNVAAGVGHFDGKSAVAVGMGYRMSEQVSLKASVGHAGSKLGASAGVSYSF